MTYTEFYEFDYYITKECNYYAYVGAMNHATERDIEKYNYFKEIKEKIEQFKRAAIFDALAKKPEISKEFFEKTLDK